MNDNMAKLFTRKELRTALAIELESAFSDIGPIWDAKTVSPEETDYLADLIYDKHGIETDISPLREEKSSGKRYLNGGKLERGYCRRCGDPDWLDVGLCPVCIETGGR